MKRSHENLDDTYQTSHGNLGNAYHCLGEYQKAIEYHKKNLEITIAIGDQSGIARRYANLRNAYHN